MGLGAALWQELTSALSRQRRDGDHCRALVVAVALGGVWGLQRAHVSKAAGMRTHMLVGPWGCYRGSCRS